MAIYNESYINEFNPNSYELVLSDRKTLENLAKNHNNRLDPMKPYYASKDLFRESLDHYVTKRYNEDEAFRNSKEMKNYIAYSANLANGRCKYHKKRKQQQRYPRTFLLTV